MYDYPTGYSSVFNIPEIVLTCVLGSGGLTGIHHMRVLLWKFTMCCEFEKGMHLSEFEVFCNPNVKSRQCIRPNSQEMLIAFDICIYTSASITHNILRAQ